MSGRTRTARIYARRPAGASGDPVVNRSPDALASVAEDAAHFPGGHADGVATPRSEAEVARLVQSHSRVLAVGAQSSLTGGATPTGGLVLSLRHMNQVLQTSATSGLVRVEAGLSLAQLQEALDPFGLCYPPVPTFTGATVGGTVATNAAGAATFRYGPTRAWVEALTIVLAAGDVLDIKRGQVVADESFEIVLADGQSVRVPVPDYRMPDVPKHSAGYHALSGPDGIQALDLIDLFIGSEGTLGVVADVTLRVIPRTWSTALAFVPVRSEAIAFDLSGALRDLAQRERARTAPEAMVNATFDIPAIEYVDRRSWALLSPAVLRQAGLTAGAAAGGALFVQLELPPGASAEETFDQIAGWNGIHAETPMGRLCRTLARFDALDTTEIALPGDARRASALAAVREAVPTAVNDQVGVLQRREGGSIEKVAGDVIVPFDALTAMMTFARRMFGDAGLDLVVWGHISDGNLHPNLLPRASDDVRRGKALMLELGREVIRLGGCPLAEHGVGRNPVKQQLLMDLYGTEGIGQMRAVKRALDPTWKLAPGVLFPAETP